MSALAPLLLVAAPALVPAPAAPQRTQLTPGSAFLNVKRFGAVGDGVRDDTLAFRRALRAAQRGATPGSCAPGGTVLIPRGDYVLSGSLEIENVRGLRLIGAGAGATTLLWRGGSQPAPRGALQLPDVALFDLVGARECLFEGFRIFNEGTGLRSAFEVSTTPTELCQSVGNEWSQVHIDGGPTGIPFGMRFLAETNAQDPALQNAFHVLRSVEVRGYLDAGFSLEHVSVRNLEFYGCRFHGEDRGLSGLTTNRGTINGQTNFGGSFRWYGGGGGHNVATDFELGDVTDTILISGGAFQGSARFLHSGGPSGNQWPILIEGNAWFDDGLGTHPTCPWPVEEQMRVVNFQFRGPITMTGNQFGVPPDPIRGPQVAKPAEIIWNPGNNFGQFLFEGNYIATSKENPFKGVTASGSSIGIYPTTMRDNLVEAEDFGSSMVVPLEVHVTRLSGSSTPTVGWLHTNRRLFQSGGGGPVTALLHGNVGQEIVIQGTDGGRTFVHGPSLQLEDSVDLTLTDGDTVTLAMFTSGVWTEIARSLR